MYNPKSIEPKWQKTWQDTKVFRTPNPLTDADFQVPKYYALDMFPYPSGAGLHVGHPKGFIATDIVSRYKHAKGFRVLHPMGWDSFGLPAENYAIKTGVHPKITTDENIANFKRQLKALGLSYDWDREIATTDPKYYKWTQWIFLKLFEAGLAYEQDLPINYCPSCKTGLANEEVVGDNICDRCGTRVERRKIRQWVLAITNYAERLLADVDSLDWPEGIKEMQRNWIGKSEGVEFEMKKGVDWNPLAIILHGWEGKAESNWFMSTKASLEQMGYEVVVPDLPNSNTPDLNEQLAFLQQFSPRLNQQSVIIGHSLGGQLAAKFIESLNMKIWTLIMVAPTYPWVADDMKIIGRNLNDHEKAFIPYTQNSVTFEKIVQNTTSRILHISQDDPYVDCDASRNYYQQLSGIQVHIHETKRHFGMEKFPEIVDDISGSLSVYTTRIDTVYGMTYVVLAADHEDVENWITPEQRSACEAYIAESKSKSDQDRTNEGKEKTGVFTGSYVVNPFNGEQIPVWIGDYVLGSYGTGAVMAVPAHDERDFEFAKKMGLYIRSSILPREKITHVGAILRTSSGKLLLQLRDSFAPRNPEKIGIFGGAIESNESCEEALVRELREELELEVCKEELLYSGDFPRLDVGPNAFIRIFEISNVDASKLVLHEGVEILQMDVDEVINSSKLIEAFKDIFTNLKYRILTDVSTLDGILVNSAKFSGLSSAEAREKFAEKAEQEGFGKKKTNYKLRDWLFSRQRYWGEPIPLIHLSSDIVNNLPEMTVTDGRWPNEFLPNKMQFRKEGEGLCYVPKAVKEAFVLNCEGISDNQKRGKYIMTVTSKTDNDFEAQILSKIYDGLYGKIICDYKLPLELPEVTNYEPAGDGNSPLAIVPEFVDVQIAPNLAGKRETNTMPQWAGSCWYYLRFIDPTNDEYLIDPKLAEYWGQVDSYVGGAEHAVLHLLYARFWHKFLFDIGVVPNNEPFQSLHNQGMILAYAYERENGGLVASDCVGERDGKFYETATGKEVKKIVAKMSKSLKNVVNPDAVIEEYGTDTFRLYEMYMSDFKDSAPWNTEAIVWVRRFLERAHTIFETPRFASDDMKAMKLLHKTIKKVGEDIEAFKFNTAISALMILLNEGLPQDEESQTEWKETFAILLHPFAPHLAEELWSMLGKICSVFEASWPEYQEFMLVDDEVTIAVQINGKLRGTFTFLNGVAQEEVAARVMEDPSITKWLEGMTIVREIFVPNKLYGIVVKE